MPIERPKSLTELVAEDLRGGIVNGEIELGSSLSEAGIAERLNVSRTPVREAINRLEKDGLVVVQPQRGTRVFSLESVDLKKICDARGYLEHAALVECFKHDRAGLVASLANCVDKMIAAIEAKDVAEYLSLDTAFHEIIFAHSGNEYLVEANNNIAIKMAALRNRLARHPDLIRQSFEEHSLISRAVGAGDFEAARDGLQSNIGRGPGSYWYQLASEDIR